MNWVIRNIARRVRVTESLCFILVFMWMWYIRVVMTLLFATLIENVFCILVLFLFLL